jgi:hypothetical protein
MRADRFDDRTDENVAMASTSVPKPVASEEIVVQSVTVDRLEVAPVRLGGSLG